MSKDLNYLCNRNCANNKYGWCKIHRCSVSKFKQLQIQDCTFYVVVTKTPEYVIEAMRAALSSHDNDKATYQKGYIDALEMCLSVIKDCDLGYSHFKK